MALNRLLVGQPKPPTVATGTCYRDKPDYAFMLSMFELMAERKVAHIPRQRHLPDIAREAIGEAFLRTGIDYLVFMDDDMSFPKGFVERLVSRQLPVLAGLYFLKSGELAPLFYRHIGLLLDWREVRRLPVIVFRATEGGYHFGVYDGKVWQAIGREFEDGPSWSDLAEEDLAPDELLAQPDVEANIETKLEWLRAQGTYTSNIYMPLWETVGRWLAAHSGEDYLKAGPLLLPDDKEAVVEVDAAGTGCMMIHRSVLEKVPRPWFSYREGGTEDMYFCRKAKAAGFRVYGDLSVICSHSGTNHTHFLKAYAKEVKEAADA